MLEKLSPQKLLELRQKVAQEQELTAEEMLQIIDTALALTQLSATEEPETKIPFEMTHLANR